MPKDAGQNLPRVLPPEEATAADDNTSLQNDLADRETAFVNESLSVHAVEAAALRNKLAKAYIDNLDADREMRKDYAARILRYLEFYSGGVLGLLLLDGAGPRGFEIDGTVLATLVGSTAVAAIGLVGFIARGLFRQPPLPPSAEIKSAE